MQQLTKAFESRPSVDRLIEEYYRQSEAITKKAIAADRLLTLAETKKLKELAGAIRNLQLTVNEGATMTIFYRFVDYINKTDHELAVRLIPFTGSYLRDVFNSKVSV